MKLRSTGPDRRARWELLRAELKTELLSWVKTIVAAIVIVLLLHHFVFNLSRVEGLSMEPVLYDDEWLFVNKLVYIMGEPKAGEIVIIEDPEEVLAGEKFLVKRIIGAPGDQIEIRSGRLYINGERIIERYTAVDIKSGDLGPLVVTDGHYFVMGDNRHAGMSRDSRAFGTVSEAQIRGRADAVIWPITRIGRLQSGR